MRKSINKRKEERQKQKRDRGELNKAMKEY